MSVRNLDILFRPRSVALIGASRRPGSIGAVLARNMFGTGFEGPVMPVNPKEPAIHGVLAYPDVDQLPLTPDLAVIATPPPTVPGIIDRLGARGCRAAVVISAGFSEIGAEGRQLETQMVKAARPHLLRILGPNCLGMMAPTIGLNASFCHVAPMRGDIALVAQSGAVLTAMVDWARGNGVGFSLLASLGNKADVDFGDMLDYLAADTETRAILLYVEAITDARKFMSAARTAARAKPVIVIKAGRSEEAARAATSHTGALAGSDAVYDAAFRRAGMLRVYTMNELFQAAETLAMNARPRGDRLAIITNGGGMGVLATDSLIGAGGHLAELAPATLAELNKVLPPTWSHANPVDIIGDADGVRYGAALAAVLTDPNADAVLVINCPVAIADGADAARATVRAAQTQQATVLTSWLGADAAREPRRLFAEARIPSYDTPEDAAQGFMHLVRYRRNQALLMEVPPSVPEAFAPDTEAVRAAIDQALLEEREWLTEPEAKQVLKAYGIPTVETVVAADPEAAAAAAARFARRVAIKILSPDITHKSDVGGVVLNLASPEAVRQAMAAMLEKVAAQCPSARLDGVTVQPMADMPRAHELILGMTEDRLFGPVLLFGEGGTAVEVVKDQALGLPPLNMTLAREMIGRTRIARLLAGYRDRPAADLDAIALTLVKISQLTTDWPELAELDINPLFANDKGVLALDARIRVCRPQQPGDARLAIRPYPKGLEKTLTLNDGRRYFVRPIRPEDAPLLHRMIERQDMNDVRLRFFAPLRRLSPQLTARLTQIDYNREMALVALTSAGPEADLAGIVRISADPDNVRAEYAVMVQSELKGAGLGWRLMNEILDYARSRGLREVFGEVLRENAGMLKLCAHLGFSQKAHPTDPGIVEVTIAL